MRTRDIELSVEERYALARLQPAKGDFVTMTVTKNLLTLLELKADEADRWGFVQQGRGRWVPRPVTDDHGRVLGPGDEAIFETRSMVNFNEGQIALIGVQLEDASKKNALEILHLRLYEIFVRESIRAGEDEALRELHAVPSAKEA